MKDDDKVSAAVWAEQYSSIREDLRELKTMLRTQFVSNDRFHPVQKIVYGLTSLILIAFVTALVSLVVRAQ